MAQPITVTDPKAAVREWYSRLSEYCRTVDFDSFEALVSEYVVSFGTKADVVTGRTPLRRNQWEGIWPNIRDFRINLDSIQSGGDSQFAWGVATWTSTGFHEDGTPYPRPGRATTILERINGKWLSVHTHFSLSPGTPSRTFGAKRRT
jgi:ketosteroid isomerase-like protein